MISDSEGRILLAGEPETERWLNEIINAIAKVIVRASEEGPLAANAAKRAWVFRGAPILTQRLIAALEAADAEIAKVATGTTAE